MTVYFDDSLPALAKAIAENCGDDALRAGVTLRDSSGKLSFYLSTPLCDERKAELAIVLTSVLGNYARTDRIVAGSQEFGVRALLDSPEAVFIKVEGKEVRFIDRRLVGADWLRAPIISNNGTPRFVFASLKGGVGRSTGLSVVAAHAAERGKRVLAIDLDLEAPGIGTMLLDETTTPRFGMIDALVERSLGTLAPEFLLDLVGASTLTDRGRIDVVPAFGARCLANPADILAKIGRVYSEVVREDGNIETMLDQVGAIVDQLEAQSRYDLILIDSRAGLHEIAAAALMGLGAEILCFGLDEPQTFQGYRALFAHIARYRHNDFSALDWMNRVNFVQAKAPIDAEQRQQFGDQVNSMLTGKDAYPKSHDADVPLPDGFSDVSWDDSVSDEDLGLTEASSPKEILSVMFDSNFASFDPLRRRDLLSEVTYRHTFGDLTNYVDEALAIREGKMRA